MIEALFNQSGYVATKKMMDATALRHEAIASNLANIETPNYKRVDVATSFQDELKAAIGARDTSKVSSLSPVLAEDTTAVAANRDGNSEDSPIFYREFVSLLQELWLAAACRAVMSNEAIDDLAHNS